MKKKVLGPKLKFNFDVDDVEVPEMTFNEEVPEEKEKTEIEVVTKKKRKENKQKELF